MGLDSIWHWLILLVIILVIFGTGKLRKVGPDLGRAVREFKKALHDNEDEADDRHHDAEPEYLKADPPKESSADTHKQDQHATDKSR